MSGPVRIETPGGGVVESDRFMVAICTCRRSTEYPLCDTSHRRCGPRGRSDLSLLSLLSGRLELDPDLSLAAGKFALRT
ncbi:iron-binding zinc finger CDGSH type family protein [Mycobacterium kansasii 732]|nr:iron-binding zinc finger CDGSH type family protein [Mycobacterium kansasii 732]